MTSVLRGGRGAGSGSWYASRSRTEASEEEGCRPKQAHKAWYCYTTRVYKEVGKYKIGESYLAPWGETLRIDDIQTYRKVSDRPFYDEMSDAEKEEIRKYSEDMGLPYEFIRFSQSKTDL